jgi:putative PIN family toxin of toxin-antitoxin system
MRIVLDTNVLLAAFASRGLCAELFEVCLSGNTIILSQHILSEMRKALMKKIKLPPDTGDAIIGYLKDTSEIVPPDLLDSSICRDKSDIAIIGTAVRGNAGFIITGDEDLLSLKRYKGIKIVNPREYWNILKQRTRSLSRKG